MPTVLIVLVVLILVLPCGGLCFRDDFLLVVDGILLAAGTLCVSEFDGEFFISAVAGDDARTLFGQNVLQNVARIINGIANTENLLALRLCLLLLLLLLHPWRQRHSVLSETVAHHAHVAGLETIALHAAHAAHARLAETIALHAAHAAHARTATTATLLRFRANDHDGRLAELRDAAQFQFCVRGRNLIGVLRSFRFNEFRTIRIEKRFLPNIVQRAHADLRCLLFRLRRLRRSLGGLRVFGGFLYRRLLAARFLL